jgi:hypothetical protein
MHVLLASICGDLEVLLLPTADFFLSCGNTSAFYHKLFFFGDQEIFLLLTAKNI